MTVRHPHHHGHDEASDRPGAGSGRDAGEPPADHSAAHHPAVDHGLHDHGRHDHGPAGSRDSIGRPTILSITCAGGERISKIRRADGSTFTVIVPRGGIDRPWDTSGPGTRWVHEDGTPRHVPAWALARLAARVGLADGPALQLLSTEN
jgi:hypothetical protein